MKPRKILYLALFPMLLGAQEARDAVPLKNWSNPLYWRATRAEREAIGRPAPQLQFSASQVSTGALSFVAVTPCRLLDTRGTTTGFSSGPPYNAHIAAGGTLTIPVQDNASNAACGTIPFSAQAYSLNITLIPVASGQVNFLSIWPAGAAQPVVATMNDKTGLILANAAIVPDGGPGISVYNSGPAATNLVIDMNGFFAAPTDLNGNTVQGNEAMMYNTTGTENTAFGQGGLGDNTTGDDNTAMGIATLFLNSTGSYNTAIGSGALYSNNGSNNTGSGNNALNSNTSGFQNTASGSDALVNNSTGSNNAATGYQALNSNATGSNNTAVGAAALFTNSTGSNNIAIGYQAGKNAQAGNSNSIYVGTQGANVDSSGTIQIGTQGTQTGGSYIAGIYNASVGETNLMVCVDSTGKLGTGFGCNSTPSSLRFKEHIADMGDSSGKVYDLRPVNFYYKPEYDDGSHTLQYGLIAEEVADIFPEMVTHGKEGQVTGIKYQVLTPMLLNELQKQAEQNKRQDQQNREQAAEIRSLEARLAALEALLSAPVETARSSADATNR